MLFIAPAALALASEKTKEGTASKTVYFTFDADMTPLMKSKLKSGQVSSWYSPGLVSYLVDKHIPATIFVTGIFAEVYPNLIKDLAKNQEIVIGNHTYDHPGFEDPCYQLRIISTKQAKQDEIIKTQNILASLLGYTPKYFRYPGLCRDKNDDKLVTDLGLIIEDKGISSGDAFNKNPAGIVRHVLRYVHDQSIVIMHLGGPNAPSTEAAVKQLVPALEKEGYVFRHL